MSLPSARPIPFNRRLRATWLREGLRLLADGTAGASWIERMQDLVKETNSGKDSITKSIRYLRHVWLEPGESEGLRKAGVNLYRSDPSENATVFISWGMTIATYPFVNDVAATLGRMLRVQPEVKLEQLLRKLSESYGDRETVRRSTRYALGLLTDFGFARHADSTGCYILGPQLKPNHAQLSAWFVRAWFAASCDQDVIDRVVMGGAPSLAFFDVPELISDCLNSGALVSERLSFSQEMLRIVR